MCLVKRPPWNHNTHYHRVLLRQLPRNGGGVCDIGSGDGAFAALLASRYTNVVALDIAAEQVSTTRALCSGLDNVVVRQGNFLDAALPRGHFDAVTALAVVHHMPFSDAADEVKRILKSGGRLVVLGVWTDRATLLDRAWNVASAGVNRLLRWRRGPDEMTAPATLERTSWPETKDAARRYLPGARLRRRVLWRYTLIWDKPVGR
jgi:SAM-dependent methyltransferase